MGKHSKHKKKRYASSSSSSSTDEATHKYKKRKKYNKSPTASTSSSVNVARAQSIPPAEDTNLINFSYLDYKSELTRVLTSNYNSNTGFHSKPIQIIENTNDFWLFMNKYETLLKKSGQPILPIPIEMELPADNNTDSSVTIPQEYNKMYTTNFQFAIPFDDFYSRLNTSSSYDSDYESRKRRKSLTPLQLKQFLQIVIHYLDFKQKEKFTKLKKLRKFQANLPVAKYRNEIVEAVKNEQVVLIAGDTGCGKSTQVPQYLHHAGFESVACTQPRRIACISLAKRVAHEMLCEYGTEVGYQIRFERSKSAKTKILFITEGLLLRQLSTDASLSQYDVLVLDEVHERHLNGDFLLGITKCLLRARPDLKIVLMSATINLKLFSNFFADENAHVIEVPGRLYPIKLHYMPQVQDVSSGSRDRYQGKSEKLSPEPYIQVMQLIDHKYPLTEKGDLLIFMSGLNEITTIVEAAKDYNEKKQTWIILPLHSSLSIADQDKVFDYAPDGMRKCIISTNIAETSITIDGIRFVIDSGKMKEMSYDPTCKMQRLKEFSISKASADQRKGRAGRTGPGICYRLYSEKVFNDFESYSPAEIHRVPLESLLLQMIAMGLPNARMFPFIEPPPMESIENSILSLKQHDAMTADEKLTPLGNALSKLPVDISIGKMLLMGCIFHQLQPVLTLAASLSVQSPFTNRAYRDHECETARKTLESDHGDPITLMNAYKEWLELKQGNFERRSTAENTKQWCRRRGLEEQRFYEITKLRNQFEDLLADCDLISLETSKDRPQTSAERAIRNGELKQLKDMRRAHKMEGPRKRKLLKSDPWGLHEGEDDTEVAGDNSKIDIRDVEFRLNYDSTKIQNLVTGATACSYRDLMTLKLIIVSGLYPQIAISDEFNYCKSASQHFFHTQAKPFVSLHPMGYFGNNADILKLNESEIITKTGLYKSKLPLSSKHQIVCYLNLLETTKAYLMNTLRMPAAQTVLLFAHTIDTNATFSRIVCDTWLGLDFPYPETGQTVLFKASNLRRLWNKLLERKLQNLIKNVDTELDKTNTEKQQTMDEMEYELWQNLANFMNLDVYYTIKRLLLGDIQELYIGPPADTQSSPHQIEFNPFADDFEPQPNSVKGGLYITENITYGCIKETDWSLQIADDILNEPYQCTICQMEYQNLDCIQRLQHTVQCKKVELIKKMEESRARNDEAPKSSSSTNKGLIKFDCTICNKSFVISVIEILRHKKQCTG